MTDSIVSPDQVTAVKDLLSLETTPHLAKGLGTPAEPCTIAAINLALTGELSDQSHPCVSETIRRWVIAVQDNMPSTLRDSPEWREAASRIPGTASNVDVENDRKRILLDWMWRGLSMNQDLADKSGFGTEWRRMLTERTHDAANAAHVAAHAASTVSHADADAAAAAGAAYLAVADAGAAAHAAHARAGAAAYAAAHAAYAARTADASVAARAAAAAYAADAGVAASAAAAAAHFANADAAVTGYWETMNPVETLNELIEVNS